MLTGRCRPRPARLSSYSLLHYRRGCAVKRKVI